jgi:hypothetical protein
MLYGIYAPVTEFILFGSLDEIMALSVQLYMISTIIIVMAFFWCQLLQ